MVIDISQKGVLTLEQTKLLNETASDIRTDYNDLIKSLVSQSENPYQWAMPLFSRNTIEHSHLLFNKLVYLAFIHKMIQKESVKVIITDSYSIFKILKKSDIITSNDITIKYKKVSWIEQIKYFWYFRLEYFGATFQLLKRFFLSKVIPKSNLYSSKKLVLAEVSILHNSFKNGVYQDRYYANFGNYQDDTLQILYLPNFVTKSSVSLFKSIRKSGNILLKEDYLKWTDYVYILTYPLRKPKFKHNTQTFYGFDIFPLIREENNREWGTYSALNALLNYHFIKRLKNSNLQIHLIIQWFENHSITKLFNLALDRFMSDITSKAYQISILDDKYYLCFYPTTFEKNYNVLPKKLAIAGKGFVQSALEFCPDMPIEVVPAFRHQEVWQKRKQFPDNHNFTILLGLSIVMEEVLNVIDMAYHIKDNPKIKIKIKPHPSIPKSNIIREFPKKNLDSFQFISGNFHQAIETSNLLVTGTSSVAVEAIAKGIPVIIIGSRIDLTHNPIPKNISQKIWKLCYTSEELAEAINYFLNLSPAQQQELNEIGKQVREDYFEPVTTESTRKFLMLDE